MEKNNRFSFQQTMFFYINRVYRCSTDHMLDVFEVLGGYSDASTLLLHVFFSKAKVKQRIIIVITLGEGQ